jgi:hypothetical protein
LFPERSRPGTKERGTFPASKVWGDDEKDELERKYKLWGTWQIGNRGPHSLFMCSGQVYMGMLEGGNGLGHASGEFTGLPGKLATFT